MQSLIAVTNRRYEMKKILTVLIAMLLALSVVITMNVQETYAAAALADDGAEYVLDIVFSDQGVESAWKLALFCTNVTPTDSSVYGDFVWCTGGVGETPKSLTVGAGWTISTITNPPQASYAQQDFSFTGDLTTNPTIYGYCITNNAANKAIGCETLTSSFTPHNGYHLYITPVVKLSTGTPS